MYLFISSHISNISFGDLGSFFFFFWSFRQLDIFFPFFPNPVTWSSCKIFCSVLIIFYFDIFEIKSKEATFQIATCIMILHFYLIILCSENSVKSIKCTGPRPFLCRDLTIYSTQSFLKQYHIFW